MKKIRLIIIGLIFLVACSTEETTSTTYGFVQDEQEKTELLLPDSYQVTMDESFELVSRYEGGAFRENMYFWHEPSANKYSFELETTSEVLEEQVPTIAIRPINKYIYNLTYANYPSYFSDDLTDIKREEIMADIKKTIEKESETQVEKIKDQIIEMEEAKSTVYTNEDYDIKPFTYMIKSELENGVIRYQLVGEAKNDYLRATLSIPSEKNEDLLEKMLASLRTITYNKEEFVDNPVLDEPTSLSYKPTENLKGSYPEVGYSFEIPETATFRYSYPVFHPYRYTFGTVYEESIEKEHFTLGGSELVIRVEKEENAKNREKELRNRGLDDFVAFQHDYARSITYLHEDEDFNTGVFTTAVRVEFDGYEEYWFLKEVDGNVYEVFFDIAFDASEYDKLLKSYLNVVRTFELKDIKE